MSEIVIEKGFNVPPKNGLGEGDKKAMYKAQLINAFEQMTSGDSFKLICSRACTYAIASQYKKKSKSQF